MKHKPLLAVGRIVLLFAAGLFLVACGSSNAGPGTLDGWYVDSGRQDMTFRDTYIPPPPPPPPPPPVEAGPDGPAPPPDGSGVPLLAVGPGPHEHVVPGSLDARTLVTGGTHPLSCDFYTGDGQGTLPSEMTLTDCQISGAFGAADLPGLYGFIVVVTDALGASVELPIAVRNGTCNTPEVILTPPEHPVHVVQPGMASSWKWEIKDVDAVCTDATCAQCPTCVKYAVGTKLPLKLTSFADCANAGDVCFSGGDTQTAPSCPAVVSWEGEIRIKDHAPLRGNDPAWVTMTADVIYSGTKTGFDCGDKNWACHVEVLERP